MVLMMAAKGARPSRFIFCKDVLAAHFVWAKEYSLFRLQHAYTHEISFLGCSLSSRENSKSKKEKLGLGALFDDTRPRASRTVLLTMQYRIAYFCQVQHPSRNKERAPEGLTSRNGSTIYAMLVDEELHAFLACRE